ncbi:MULTISPECIES: alkaline phosphatase family protein [unclassified Microbulbifer]|uniref:alkaline phosphatase family protein n=1 Tax=unclassified Microbulbifer TaxID=2619833 RepID=UPI0027E5A52A|nr:MULTISPECIES: alkaline phosphatase family protein [unclassified Microbulbifer]
MKYFHSTLTTLLVLLFSAGAHCADNLVVVTLDGLRWQEVFAGYDEALLDNKDITEHPETLLEKFGGGTAEERREKLMPLLWGTVQQQGALLGNRNKKSTMDITNTWWFSYPGYNEILTGRADPKINSNKPIPNRNTTFLEWLNGQPEFAGKVAAFGSWDVFPAIINRERSGVYINAGFESANWTNLSERARFLNELQAQTPSPWANVRLDAFTYGFAKEYLRKHKPRVLYIALGETDDFAHDKEYHQYLRAAHRSDRFLADLWQTLQSMDSYRDNTNLIITVDHGCGRDADSWPHHASEEAVKQYFNDLNQFREDGIAGADEIWFAALGPDIRKIGEVSGGKALYQNQVAATALTLLEKRPGDFDNNIGPAMEVILK